jgi:hypothetical protein
MRALLALAMPLVPTTALAQDPFSGTIDPPPKQWPDSPLNKWFKSLERPDNHLRPPFDETNAPTSCCGAGDTVDTKFKVERGKGPHPDDVWYAWLDDAWVKIAPEKIISDFAPDGKAYLFILRFRNAYEPYEHDEIVCFVRPKGGL